MSSPTLTVHTAAGLVLPEATRAFQTMSPKDAIALLYHPAWCRFARVDGDGIFTGQNGGPLDLAGVFEARLFNSLSELRWLADHSGQNLQRSTILTESPRDSAPGDSWKPQSVSTISTLAQTYLLWGEGTGAQPSKGWSQLATSRIGALAVPITGVNKNERVLLHTVEYLVRRDDGNVTIYDERLVKLEVVRG